MGKLYGYARVSTSNQNVDMQIDALLKAGVDKEDIFIDEGFSGSKASRPQFDKLLSVVQEGDTVVAWKLDRLGRSLENLCQLASLLKTKGVFIKTIMDGIDTGTSMGKMIYGILSTLAEFERDVIMERIETGKALARANGVKFGRKRALKAVHVDDIKEKLKTMSTRQVADFFKVSERTIFRCLAELKLKEVA